MADSLNLKFRELLTAEDEKRRQELFTECFPETIGTSASTKHHFNWKFKSYLQSWTYIATNGPDIIGGYSALRYDYLLNGKPCRVGMVCDVMTGIKARGRGVFTKLGTYATESILNETDVLTGYPIRPEVIPGHLKVGWTIVDKLPLYVKVINIKSKLESLGVPSFLSLLIQNLYSFFNQLLCKESDINNVKIFNSWHSFESIYSEEYDSFFPKSNNWSTFRLYRSSDYMGWRLSAPNRDYKILVKFGENSNNICDMAVVRRIQREGLDCLCVLDCLTVSHGPALSRILESYARKINCDVVLMMSDKISFKMLSFRKSFWLESGKQFSWILKTNSFSIKQEIENSIYSLFWIDCDDL